MAEHLFSDYFKSFIKVISGNLATTFISLVTSILVARWIIPSDMGVWNLAMLVSAYSPALQLGVFNGLNRELPHLIGAGNKEKAFDMASVSYSWCLILAATSVLVTLIFTCWFWYQGQIKYCHIAMAMGTIVSCSWLTLYLTTTYRTFAEFGRLAKNSTLVALVGLALVILVWRYGFNGLITRAALLAILGAAALYYKRPILVRPRWEKSLLLDLVRVGLPIWFLGQLDTFFMMLDRLFLANSTQLLGYYTTAIQIETFVCMIPIGFTIVLYPQMAHKYGETHKAMDIWRIATKGAVAASALGIIAGISGWLLIPRFVEVLIPKYIPGTNAAQWAALIGLARGLSVYNNVYNVIKRQDIYLVCLAIGLTTFVGGWLLLTRALSQPRMIASIQSMLLATLIMSISSAILSRLICRSHDYNNLVKI